MKSEMSTAFLVGKHGGGTPFGDQWGNWKNSFKHYEKEVCVECELIWTGSRNCPLTDCEGILRVSIPDNTRHLHETDIHAAGGIRTHNPSKRAAAGINSIFNLSSLLLTLYNWAIFGVVR